MEQNSLHEISLLSSDLKRIKNEIFILENTENKHMTVQVARHSDLYNKLNIEMTETIRSCLIDQLRKRGRMIIAQIKHLTSEIESEDV